jgi:hypothetical protein
MITSWIPEPSQPDPTWARPRESAFEWALRSTRPRAVELRRYLNENLAALPDGSQAVVLRALRDRWSSGYFELVVARTLQLAGATISIEEEVETDGRRLDFHAGFIDGARRVETVSPIVDGWAGDIVKLQRAAR